ncbi:helicase DnaB [Hyphomicrobiales bacterium BP6-180914]|uniref:DNA 5'-3' helicase n=2 Tax=Lichenifustis flavocetrariae TaxID=2949735 RepID=A0AA41Z2P4_9HYPH|nr:helicase DnaB [Lichenifustis flavocetrariae]
MEQALLGALLLNNKLLDVVAPVIKADDLFEEIHRRTFEVAASLIGSGQVATPVTLGTFPGDQDLGSGLTVKRYLARLCAEATTLFMAKDYALGIHDLAIRRKIILIANELAEQAYDLPVQARPAQVAGDAIALLHGLVGEEGTRSTRKEPLAEAGAIIARIKRVQSGEEKKRLVSTGFDDLDRATTGYQPGALWVLAARPGMGKTTFFVASANRAARRGAGVLGFALEVGNDQIHSRILADLAYSSRDPISFKNIMADEITPDEVWRLETAQERLGSMPLTIDVPSRLTPSEIRMRIRTEKDRMAATGVPLNVVFIDYLKQIQASDRYSGNRVYEVGEISYSLKQIAKDEGICIVLLAQLNRALESREDKRPILADLRESGDLEADADVVAFLHREAMYIQRSPAYLDGDPDAVTRFLDEQNRAELILGKNRAGETRTVSLWCDMACSTMSDHVRGAAQ